MHAIWTKATSELTLKEPRENILKYIQWLGFHKVGKLYFSVLYFLNIVRTIILLLF